MAFRKKVKKLFSKLHHNNDAAAGSAAGQSDTATPPARRASVANAAEPPRSARAPDARPPPLISKASAFPTAINRNYRPSGVVADLGDKFGHPFSTDVDGATGIREDGYILPHPGQAAGPAFVQGSTEDRLIRPGVVAEGRNTSVVTVATTASSDYDQHSTTNSLHNQPVHASGVAVRRDHSLPNVNDDGHDFDDRKSHHSMDSEYSSPPPSLPSTFMYPPPSRTNTLHSRRSPDINIIKTNSNPLDGHPIPEITRSTFSNVSTNSTTDVSRSLSPPVVQQTIQPVQREEETTVITREHHHHEVHPIIQPVVAQQTLPPKYFLESEDKLLREISAEEARRYGEPVWRGDVTVASESVEDELNKMSLGGHNETVRTRLSTPESKPVQRMAGDRLSMQPLPGDRLSMQIPPLVPRRHSEHSQHMTPVGDDDNDRPDRVVAEPLLPLPVSTTGDDCNSDGSVSEISDAPRGVSRDGRMGGVRDTMNKELLEEEEKDVMTHLNAPATQQRDTSGMQRMGTFGRAGGRSADVNSL
ncbi:hypothetical protein BZA77DRAFT_290680 [Pyronema omphalodes]|nr:hypothetical protein BZA77DRAFT_290680 [Pyronema omphalodes]